VGSFFAFGLYTYIKAALALFLHMVLRSALLLWIVQLNTLICEILDLLALYSVVMPKASSSEFTMTCIFKVRSINSPEAAGPKSTLTYPHTDDALFTTQLFGNYHNGELSAARHVWRVSDYALLFAKFVTRGCVDGDHG
jgi:hypothetical protein